MRHRKRDQFLIVCAAVFFMAVGWSRLNRRGASSDEGGFYRKNETAQDRELVNKGHVVSDAPKVASGEGHDRRASSNNDQTGFVHVAGAIRHPGVYPFSEGDRIGDVIKKAGGLADNAAVENINLAQRLVDEMQIRIPVKEPDGGAGEGEAMPPRGRSSAPLDSSTVTVPSQDARLNLNTATVEQLQDLPSIGPKRAQEIVDRREAKPFQSVEELLGISGIGEKTLEKLRDLVVVH